MIAAIEGRHLVVPVILYGSSAIVEVRVDLETCDCSMRCAVRWPDEVFASDNFGSEWRRWDA